MLLELALLLPGSSPSGKVPFRPPWLPELEIPGAFAGLVPPPMPIPKEHERKGQTVNANHKMGIIPRSNSHLSKQEASPD